MQYRNTALNLRIALWAVLLRIERLGGAFDVRHHQDLTINNLVNEVTTAIENYRNAHELLESDLHLYVKLVLSGTVRWQTAW